MKVLITGATGIVGSRTVKEFLEKGHEVFCLVRGDSKKSAEERLCEKIGESNLPKKCHVIEGDITKELCGIKAEVLENLKQLKIDKVFHCAANTKMDEKYLNESININLVGTINLTYLSKILQVGHINFISTAYTANGLSNIYEKTKSESEKIIENSNIPYTISRISIVIGDSESGEVVDFTGYYGFVMSAYKIVKRFGKNIKLTAEAKPDATLNLIPVDWVARTLVKITEKDPMFKVINVVNKEGVQVEKVFRMGLDVLGMNGNVEFVEDTDFCENSKIIHQKMFNKVVKILRPYTSKKIEFSDEVLKKVLGDKYEEAPQINEKLIANVINYSKSMVDLEINV